MIASRYEVSGKPFTNVCSVVSESMLIRMLRNFMYATISLGMLLGQPIFVCFNKMLYHLKLLEAYLISKNTTVV